MQMASVSKKINKLVSKSENDLTAELEIPEFDPDEREIVDHQLDRDAETSEFKQSDIQAAFDERSGDAAESDSASPSAAESDSASPSAAESDADSPTSNLDRLHSDIERLRADWTELESEINKKYSGEIDQLNSKLKSSEQELDDRQRKLDALGSDLEQAKENARQSADEIEEFRKHAKETDSRIRNLEKQLKASEKKTGSIEFKLQESETRREKENKDSDSRKKRIKDLKKELAESQGSLSELRNFVDGREDTWKQVEKDLAQAKTRLEQSDIEVEKLSRVIKNRDAEVERNQASISKLSKQLGKQAEENKELEAENRELHRISRNDAAKELERSLELIAEQSGRLTGYEQQVSALTSQIDRTERYADDLRRELRDQSELAEGAVSERQGLITACTTAESKLSDLTEELTATKKQNAALSKKLNEIEKNFDDEVRKIRDELGVAQETIVDQDTINVQLTSDLFNTKGSQQSLETQLEEIEEQYEQKIQELEQQANKLRNQVDDYEYKLENKDEAIAALMNELSNRSEAIESIDEVESAIQEIESVIDDIDERLPTRLFDEQEDPEPDETDAERVTRLLIGQSDGQELRFPLFKDRLTIGRTAHNDIQLDAQFISRQHAVIVTEKGGTKIVDWGSKNGILVNEKRVVEQVLENGDVVTIGTTDFRYEERPKR
jgi:chromosome segregation ATPase